MASTGRVLCTRRLTNTLWRIAVKPTIQNISQALQECTLIFAPELLGKIENGGWRLSRGFAKAPTPCDRLLETYSIRIEELRNRKSKHARQLYAATNEFLKNLSKNMDKACFLNDVEGDEEFEFFIAFEPTQKKMIGVLKVVSKLKVSKNTWSELWTKP